MHLCAQWRLDRRVQAVMESMIQTRHIRGGQQTPLVGGMANRQRVSPSLLSLSCRRVAISLLLTRWNEQHVI
jgi:hypothetical protein